MAQVFHIGHYKACPASIFPPYQFYLWFALGNQNYPFLTLSFGLPMHPMFKNKVLSPILALLCSHGIHVGDNRKNLLLKDQSSLSISGQCRLWRDLVGSLEVSTQKSCSSKRSRWDPGLDKTCSSSICCSHLGCGKWPGRFSQASASGLRSSPSRGVPNSLPQVEGARCGSFGIQI